jgi:hypothetical protein
MKKRGFWIAGGVVLTAVAAVVLILFRPGRPERPALVLEAVNRVDAHAHPRDDWKPALVGLVIYGGGQVRTGPASSARLELLEGVVRLAADTLFTVKECTIRQDRLVATLFLQEGRLWAHLTADQPHQFTVETASAVAAVRDTHLSVKVAPDQTTLVSVAKGAVVLTAQGESVTVAAGEQATVTSGRPPGPPEPMSDEERLLWATEGEMSELAPPTSTPLPKPTPTSTPTPVKIGMLVDVYCALTGPAGDPLSRHPRTKLEAKVQSRSVAQVRVETPDGKIIVLPSFGDIYGEEQRFLWEVEGLPQTGGAYTFTALNADGKPIPGAVASDVYLGEHEPNPPANIQAQVVEDGLLVTWDPSPVIPGTFDPSTSPPLGSYQMSLQPEGEGNSYGWNHFGRPLPETSHLIPFRRRDFGRGDLGRALDELEDGLYHLDMDAFSVAPQGTAGQGHECAAIDPAERVWIVIEAGQVRVQTP